MSQPPTFDPPSGPLLLHTLFFRQAEKEPDRTAIVYGGQRTTYSELRNRVESIAASLDAHGVGEGSLVGLHLERSTEWVAGLLGILATNAAVVPLPPTDPAQRLHDVFSYAELDAVLDSGRSPLPFSPGVPSIRLENALAAPAIWDPSREGRPDQPAFVLSSSGSTGRPKLIARSHRSFFHRLAWTWRSYPFGPDDVGCQKAHLTTTHAVYELFEPLLAGAPTLVLPDGQVRDLERFWEAVHREGVTRLLMVPSAMRASLDLPEFAAPVLKALILMGEHLPRALASRVAEAFPEATPIYSIYGSTEASSTLVCDVRASLADGGGELPLGTPIADEVRALVLSPEGEVLRPGSTGRLHISGSPLFLGYLRDQELTRTVLGNSAELGGPVFDTRDEVRLREDGSLEYMGRADHMVKVRGFRVDLPEVERAMLAHPGVTQAAVVAKEDPTGAVTLIGFHLPASIGGIDVLRTVGEQLPPYMVPAAVVGLDEFPLTPSAKVDRQKLLLEFAHGGSTASAEGALTALEQRVAKAWEATLGHSAFGSASSFFEVGGDSLSVFELVHRLREEFALQRDQLPGEAVYRFPTLGSLATHIEVSLEGAAPVDVGDAPILVTMRGATDAELPPLFLVSSAGGTLGAYEKLARELRTPREIIGIRDPFLWGKRDPSEGFDRWVGIFLEAVRARQPRGPYHLCAYSSAGAFGYELACRLRDAGEEVALLTLVDPLALDRSSQWRFGYWALRATWARSQVQAAVKLAGHLRVPVVRALHLLRRDGAQRMRRATDAFDLTRAARTTASNKGHIENLAALLELNTDLPFSLREEDFEGIAPDGYLGVLQKKVAALTPEIDPEMIERLAVQYELQVRSQHAYRLRPYDGRTLLIEPTTRYAGLTAALLRPYVRRLTVQTVPLGAPSDRAAAITARFGALVAHYRSMRDDTFVRGLAGAMDAHLP